MEVFTQISPLKKYLNSFRCNDATIGFVPTMGALHEGHLSLIRKSLQENKITVCSIYVNPTQFNNPDDLKKYPRNIEKDKNMLEKEGCEVLFLPDDQVMYPSKSLTSFNFGYLEEIMEGKFRPAHFKGVGLVVNKLLHIVQPNNAYFGQKDLQQYIVLKQMVKDLYFDVNLIAAPIVRESDGLAMSSRNIRLTPDDRKSAAVLIQALQKAAEILKTDGFNLALARKTVIKQLAQKPSVSLEYFEIVNAENLLPVSHEEINKPVALCIAAMVGEVRLIDNLILFH